jgi:undecaprenyl-diphosphatase
MIERSPSPLTDVAVPVALGAGGYLGFLYVAGRLWEKLTAPSATPLDIEVGNALGDRRSQLLNNVASVVGYAGEPWTLYPVSGLLALRWLTQGRRADAVTLLTTLATAAAADKGIKNWVRRPRPRPDPLRPSSAGFSFPSQHNTMSTAAYGMMAHLARRQARQDGRDGTLRRLLPVLLREALIGWSRTYKGVHYVTDVLGGWATGAAVLGVGAWLRRLWQ